MGAVREYEGNATAVSSEAAPSATSVALGVDRARAASERPLACVLGNMNLIRALGRAGIRSAAVTRSDAPPAFSRFVDERVKWADNWGAPDELLANILEFARGRPVPPILFYQHDGDLMFVSRNRDRLAEHTRFVIAGAELIEQIVDKTRFCELATRAGLPIPRSIVLHARPNDPIPDVELDYPAVIKPLTRRDRDWRPIAGEAKALELDTPDDLRALWPQLVAARLDLVVQELVPGSEDRIESYHAYVDDTGAVAGEFTGRKVRTLPRHLGDTTALEITDEADVRDVGRDCMQRLGLRGVAKLDFKRAPDGRLYLLEINPRFNLWHLPGAIAGVNIPALVYADLAGLPRPATGPVTPGVTWSVPWKDLRAARAWGVSPARWLAWQVRSPSRHVLALDDPLPFARGMAWRHARRRFRISR